MTEVNRQELYEQVWSEPMTKLSKNYGISDVGLRQICIRMGVPTPLSGYWAQIRAGYDVPKPELMEFDPKKHVQTYKIEPTEKILPPMTDEQLEQQLKPVKNLAVLEKLLKPHPLITEAKNCYKNSHTGGYGEAVCNESVLHLRVSKGLVDRALIILDTVIKGLELLQFKVENGKHKRQTFVTVHGTPIHFYIDERFKQLEHVPTQEEKKEQKNQFSLPGTNMIMFHRVNYLSKSRIMLMAAK